MTAGASLYAVFLCMIFGANAVAIKVSLNGVGPITASGTRFAISAIVIFCWAAATKQSLRISINQARQLFILSMLFALQSTFLYSGLTRTTASHGVLITNMQPFVVMILAHFFIMGDRMTLKKVAGLIFGFSGVIFLFYDAGQNALRVGNAMILCSAFFWGCNVIYAKKIIHQFTAIQITWYPMLFACPILIFSGSILDPQMIITISPKIITAILYQSVIATAFGFIAWNGLLRRFGATALHSFVFLMPPAGVFFSVILLKEPFSTNLAVSIIMILTGLIIVNATPRQAHAG